MDPYRVFWKETVGSSHQAEQFRQPQRSVCVGGMVEWVEGLVPHRTGWGHCGGVCRKHWHWLSLPSLDQMMPKTAQNQIASVSQGPSVCCNSEDSAGEGSGTQPGGQVPEIQLC